MDLEGVWFNQEGKRLFSSAMRAVDLLERTNVDVYRQENGNAAGYQRAAERPRARAFARYLQTQNMPLVPTAVLLNVREGISSNPQNNGADLPDGVQLWVIDGQHRIEGFRHAIEEMGIYRLREVWLPLVTADGLTVEGEAEQFRVINETAKKVRTDLARRILALSARGREGRQQIRKQDRLWEATASDIISALNGSPKSPLLGRIQGPNEKKTSRHAVRELSFSTSLRPILTTFPYQDWGVTRLADRLSDYWRAWQDVLPVAFDRAEDYVLLRATGIFSLHQIALYVWEVFRRRNVEPTVAEIAEILSDLGDYSSPPYWERDNAEGAAVFGGMKGAAMLTDVLKDELRENGHVTE